MTKFRKGWNPWHLEIRMSHSRYYLKLLILVLLVFTCSSCAGAPEGGKAVRMENTPVVKSSTVAVWDLDDLSPATAPQQNLGEMLSGRIVETVQQKGTYTVVERQRLVLALEELNLGSSSLADEATRLRLGKLAGAQLMVFGAYQVIAGKMRLDVRLVEVETGRIVKAVEKIAPGGNLGTWLDAARQAAEELL